MSSQANPRGKNLPVLGACLALTLVASQCPSCPPVHIQNVEAFQIAFLDNGGAIRALYSSDGATWTASNPPGASADAGVGVAASPDGAGLMRVIAHGGNVGRLHLRFGLGGANWDSSDVVFNNMQPHRRPTIIHLGQNIYLLAMLGGAQNNQAVVLRYDHSSRQFTDVSPTGIPNLNNSMLHHSPAMIFLPPNQQVPGRTQNRVVMAYLRHSAMGSFSPQEMQIVTADADSAGNVTWLQAVTYNFPDLDVGPPLTEPALAHDQRIFYLAVVRHYNKTSQPPASVYNLYVHASSNGINWTIPSVIGNLFIMPSGGFLEMAMTSDCKAVLAGIPITVSQVQPPKVYRNLQWPTWPWQPVTTSSVFGPNRPMERQFALITTGKPAQIPLGSCR